MDCSPPGSSVHGILQARVLGWGAIAFCKWGALSLWFWFVFPWGLVVLNMYVSAICMPSFEKYFLYISLYQWEIDFHVLSCCCLISFCFNLKNSLRVSCKAGLVAMNSHSFCCPESLYLLFISEVQLCWAERSRVAWVLYFVLFVHLAAVVALVLGAHHRTLSGPTRLLRNTLIVLCMWQTLLLFMLSKLSLLLTFGNINKIYLGKDLSIFNLAGVIWASWIRLFVFCPRFGKLSHCFFE